MGWTFSSTNQNQKGCNSFSFFFIERFGGPPTWSREFAQTMGNILTAFWLATIKKEVVEEVLKKKLQELTNLKGQLL